MSNIKWRNDGSGLGDADYLPDGVVVHDMVYRLPVKGAKKKPKQPRKPVITKDSAASMSFFKGDYGTSEGEIYGLVDGGKSIFLEGTPLLDDDGNPNFEGVTWEERKGTLDQEYMKGFPDVSNEVGIGVELKGGTPWVRSITNTQLSAIRLRFKWDRLAKTNPDNGDVTGYRIDYAIDLRTDGGAYQEVLSTKIEDKTSAGYERTHRIDLPKSKTGWSVRVRRITPNANSEYIADKMYIDALAEVIDVKLAYPLTAGIGLQYNAELFNGVAKVEFLKRGRILKVPTNYNAETRQYTGIWDGTFKEAYSNNPAWVLYDLLTNKRYGLGNRLDASMIDKWSIYNHGRHCDQMVSDGQGGLEPRFTCNVYLQKQATAYEVLRHIAGIFSALSYWNGEKIFLDADIPRDPVFTFTNANVVGGSFSYSGTRARDRHNIIKVAWDNPANGFKTEYEYVRDERSIAMNGIKPLDLAAFGCTSQSQAQRLGLRALKTEQLETQQVTFSTGLAAINCKIGDVIAISDASLAGKSNGGLISNVDGNVITIDRDAVINIGDTLTVNTAKGLSERRNVTAVNGRQITVAAAFDGAEREHVWSVESSDLKMQLFRVMSVTENDDATYSVLGIQHEPQKFNAIDFGTDVKPTTISIVDDIAITPPESVVIKSRHRVEQGQTVATLIIEWSQVKEAVAYEVEWRKDDGSWIRVPRTGTNSVEIDGVYAGQYLARVRSVGAFDTVSNPTTSMLTEVKGKVGKPPKLAALKAVGILFGMELSWSFAPGSKDADYVEIEQGSAPDTNVSLLGQFSYPTDRHEITGLQGGLKRSYRARLVDKLGFKSDWTDWATATVDDSADKVLDLIEGQITESHLYQELTDKINLVNKIEPIDQRITKEVQDRIKALGEITEGYDQKFISVDSSISDAQAAADAANEAAQQAKSDAQSKAAAAEKAAKDYALAQAKAEADAAKAAASSDASDKAAAAESAAKEAAALDAKNKADAALEAAKLDAKQKADAVKEIADKAAEDIIRVEGAVSTLKETVDGNTGLIVEEKEIRVQRDAMVTQKLDYLSSEIDMGYADKTKYADKNRSIQWTLATAISAENYTQNQKIENLQSEFQGSTSQIQKELLTLASKDLSIASEQTRLSTAIGKNSADILDLSLAVTGPEKGLSAQVTQLQATAEAAQRLAGTKGEIIYSVAEPPSKDRLPQNLWFKKEGDNTTPHIWDVAQSKWVALTDKAAAGAKVEAEAAKQAAGIAQDAADAKGEVIYSSTAPAADKRKTQNLWVDTTNGKNVFKRWNGSAWVAVTDQTAVDIANSKGEVITSDKIPDATKRLSQNLWIDTRQSKNTPRRWNGTAWEAVTDQAAIDAVNDVKLNLATYVKESGAYSTEFGNIAGEITTIQSTVKGVTDSIEVVAAIGDAERLKYEISKERLNKNKAALQGKVADLDSLIAKYKAQHADARAKKAQATDAAVIASYDAQIALLNTSITDAETQRREVASQVTQLDQEIKELASLKLTESEVKKQYFVKFDSGNRAAGFGIMENADATIDFAVLADKFYIAPPSGTGKGVRPFAVYTSPTTINGAVVPAGTYIDNAFIANGTLDAAKIKDATITTAKIGSAAITSAKIDDLAVTSGKIANLAVDTLQIADNAVTIPMAAMGTSENISLNEGVWTDIIDTNLENKMGTVSVNINFSAEAQYIISTPNSQDMFRATARVYARFLVDSDVHTETNDILVWTSSLYSSGSLLGGATDYTGGTATLIRHISRNPAKNQRLRVQLRADIQKISSRYHDVKVDIKNPRLTALTTKK